MLKNVFCFILKALFVFKIFKFLSQLFGHVGKTTFMTSQSGQQTVTIHIFPNISHSKSNQTMKSDQFIEYKKRNIFSLKIIQKMKQVE